MSQLNPADEFTDATKPLNIAGHSLEFHLGSLDLSISKAVVYLWLAAVLIFIVGYLIARVAKVLPDRKQAMFEILYDYVRDFLVGAVMPAKAAAVWFPYIMTLFLFILVSNIIGLVPLPFNLAEGFHNIPEFKTYAATANINVTIPLALLTFLFTHGAGIKANGPVGYFKGWVPGTAPGALKPVLWFLHAISELFRMVSLSVRLFANLVAGHLVLLVFYSMILMLQTWLLFAFLAPLLEVSVLLVTGFEVFVALIQAYIFAILSAVYIGGAIHQEH
ncbi:MAG: F0F1 ATP synthase subunit A [Thermoleophilia bacterium]